MVRCIKPQRQTRYIQTPGVSLFRARRAASSRQFVIRFMAPKVTHYFHARSSGGTKKSSWYSVSFVIIVTHFPWSERWNLMSVGNEWCMSWHWTERFQRDAEPGISFGIFYHKNWLHLSQYILQIDLQQSQYSSAFRASIPPGYSSQMRVQRDKTKGYIKQDLSRKPPVGEHSWRLVTMEHTCACTPGYIPLLLVVFLIAQGRK